MADAYIEGDDVADLVVGTLNELGHTGFQQIAQRLHRYEVMSKWLTEDKMLVDTGIGIKRSLMLDIGGAESSHVGRYQKSAINIGDHLAAMRVPWRYARQAWGYDYHDMTENKGKARITNIIKPRQAGAELRLAGDLETKAWQAPGTANKTDPYGIPYWVVQNAVTGFNGGHPGAHTATGEIDRDVYANFKNYTDTYTAWTKIDLIKPLRTAHRQIHWHSPVTVEDFNQEKGYRLYTDGTTIDNLEDIGEAQNENLGRDLAPMKADTGGGSRSTKSGDITKVAGTLSFRRHPLIWVDELDTLTTNNPIFMIDHDTFQVVVQSTDNLRRQRPIRAGAEQPDVWVVWTSIAYNYICLDPRHDAVLYKV